MAPARPHPVGAAPVRPPLASTTAPRPSPASSSAAGAISSPAASAPLRASAPPPAAGEDLDLAGLWKLVLAQVQQQPSLGWLLNLAARKLDGDVLVIGAQPGRRDSLNGVSDRQQQQLRDLLQRFMGKPMAVRLETSSAATGAAGEAPSAPAGSQAATQRRQAMELPLVKQVLEAFRDVTLVDVQAEAAEVVSPAPAVDDQTCPVDQEPSLYAGNAPIPVVDAAAEEMLEREDDDELV